MEVNIVLFLLLTLVFKVVVTVAHKTYERVFEIIKHFHNQAVRTSGAVMIS